MGAKDVSFGRIGKTILCLLLLIVIGYAWSVANIVLSHQPILPLRGLTFSLSKDPLHLAAYGLGELTIGLMVALVAAVYCLATKKEPFTARVVTVIICGSLGFVAKAKLGYLIGVLYGVVYAGLVLSFWMGSAAIWRVGKQAQQCDSKGR